MKHDGASVSLYQNTFTKKEFFFLLPLEIDRSVNKPWREINDIFFYIETLELMYLKCLLWVLCLLQHFYKTLQTYKVIMKDAEQRYSLEFFKEQLNTFVKEQATLNVSSRVKVAYFKP